MENDTQIVARSRATRSRKGVAMFEAQKVLVVGSERNLQQVQNEADSCLVGDEIDRVEFGRVGGAGRVNVPELIKSEELTAVVFFAPTLHTTRDLSESLVRQIRAAGISVYIVIVTEKPTQARGLLSLGANSIVQSPRDAILMVSAYARI